MSGHLARWPVGLLPGGTGHAAYFPLALGAKATAIQPEEGIALEKQEPPTRRMH